MLAGKSSLSTSSEYVYQWFFAPEWSLDSPSTQAQKTIDTIASLGVNTSEPYPLVDALHELLEPHPARIKNLIPFLTQWRDGLPT